MNTLKSKFYVAFPFTALTSSCSLLVLGLLLACSTPEENDPDDMINTPVNEEAAVTAVSFTGTSNNYTLSVTIASPDTGCDQYADWWEVFKEDGTLLYRRILAHSHVNEQPFTRSGGPVNIGPDEVIYVRAHMNNFGYGATVFKGTIGSGLVSDSLDVSFAADLETQSPLPEDCAF